MARTSGRTWDAVVVGAGHNGLVAAAYLARAGLDVAVLERREVVGGAAVTEELLPGYRVSTAAYSLSLLRPDVWRDLDLGAHGLSFSPKDPQLFVPLPDGRHFFVWRDTDRTCEELARIHGPDADAYRRWNGFWDEAVALLRPLVEAPDPPRLGEVEHLLIRKGREDVWRLAVAGSAAETVEAFFESDEVRGTFASQGIIGTAAGPRHPGTAWVMAYHALGGELNGAAGTWAYVLGGMGSVTRAIADAAEAHGTRIRTGAPVEEVLVDGGRAVGVRLGDGSTVEARVVLSGADPVRTFLGLVPAGVLDEAFLGRVRAWRTPGSVVKVNLALAELPGYRSLPGTAPGPQHAGTLEISPSVAYLDAAFSAAQAGRYPDEPFMEVFVQSATDPTLAPPGHHVLSAFTQWAPAIPGDGGLSGGAHAGVGVPAASWPQVREEALATVLRTLGSYAPNLPGAVLAADVLGPPELEERLGLTGGNIFHGELLPEQCFGERFGYRTPLHGLYLCGSGARPGGCIMGAPGRNAARAVLADLAASQAEGS
ncbi:MAG TPA: NAD(P)/FAD-dependent oxidoreductase [Actinomycetota bacterium]|jgi:phytoene dehydrogenase-like protein